MLKISAVYSFESQMTIWRNICSPYLALKNKTSKKSVCRKQQAEPCLSPAFTLFPSLAYPYTLNRETACSSITPFDIQRTTRRRIPEDMTLQRYCYIHIYRIYAGRLCGLAVRVPGYRYRGPDFLRSSGSGTGYTQPRKYN
jgi:hypothetical protein